MKPSLEIYQVLLLLGSSLVLAGACFYFYRRREKYRNAFIGCAVGLVVFVWPATYLSLSVYHLNRSKSVEFCGSCHSMELHIRDVASEASKSLAGKHAQRFWVNKDPCYTCHTDYTLFGPVKAKMKGMAHMYHALFHPIPEPEIALYHPYPDGNCLQCHRTKRMERVEEHLDADPEERCVDCHDNVHKVQAEAEAEASEEDEE